MKMFKNKLNRSSKATKNQQQEPIFKQNYFKNCHRTYSCIHCRAHLANHDELISKLFQGNHGRAYLFNKVVNVGCKQAVQRELLTGLHAVADIYCDSCETTLGWKYEQAFVPSQKYKEGKYIIELVHMLKENDWDLTSYNTRELLEEADKSQLKNETSAAKNFRRFNFLKKDINVYDRANINEIIDIDRRLLPRSRPPIRASVRQNETSTNSNSRLRLDRCSILANKQMATIDIGQFESSRRNEQVDPNIRTDELELLERSLNRIQLLDQEENFSNSELIVAELPSTSPDHSLCSSRSQSDMSSSNSSASSSLNSGSETTRSIENICMIPSSKESTRQATNYSSTEAAAPESRENQSNDQRLS